MPIAKLYYIPFRVNCDESAERMKTNDEGFLHINEHILTSHPHPFDRREKINCTACSKISYPAPITGAPGSALGVRLAEIRIASTHTRMPKCQISHPAGCMPHAPFPSPAYIILHCPYLYPYFVWYPYPYMHISILIPQRRVSG
jgi:hypothetical protein